MEVSAIAKGLRISPQKARLVADQVRGKPVAQAIDILNFSKQKGARLLRVREIFVNEGMTMKRLMPRAKGRADRITKRTSHVTVTVSDSSAKARD